MPAALKAAPGSAPDPLTEARQGLPRTNRVLHSATFGAIIKSGKKNSNTWFTVYHTPNTLSRARLGITVSRKTSPKATLRNLIKRHVRESFRLVHGRLDSQDIVVLARRPAATASGEELRAALQWHWEKIFSACVKS